MADQEKVSQESAQVVYEEPGKQKVSQESGQVVYEEPGKQLVSQVSIQVVYEGMAGPPVLGISQISMQVVYQETAEGPLMAQLMRHGTWFSSGGKQPMWWAK